jgi:ABC-type phosphate transport system substrate-binding protein
MLRSVVIGFVAVCIAGVAGANAFDGSYKVIVNAKVGGRSVPKDVLAQVYLGQANRWGNGTPIAAVDLSTTSLVRKAFSEEILGMPVDAVKNLWLKKLSSGGARPLLSKASDDEVIAFVAAQPGGVGYVSSTVTLPATVVEVSIQ